MKKKLIFTIALICLLHISFAQQIQISFDKSSVQQKYAAEKLTGRLLGNGYQTGENGIHLIFKTDTSRLTKEAFSIEVSENTITIIGGDGTGLIYGANSIIEDIRNGVKLSEIKPKIEAPDLMFRAIKYDLPWDTYRHSYSLTQHQETCSDTTYWEAFLDMMCYNRFNVLTVWNLHPYTFMIRPTNFPEASEWTDEQMQEWKHLFTSIFRMARERGIDTYVMPFNIFVPPSFARHHGVALNNLEHHHYVQADTSQIIRTYTRECVTQLLNEYPDLTGMGLTLGEGMGGMTPAEREQWMQETIIEGMKQANRTSKLIHRIPFSGNTASLGATTIEMEKVTRQGIEKEAALKAIEKPVWASMKFNWSHPHSTTKLIKVHGGKLYGTYFNPEPKDFRIIWTVRNEDFFCLRWGAVDFIRKHIRQNSHSYVDGYFIGSETYIPAKDYFTNPAYNVSWKYAFERQWLFYKLWGRLLYKADTPDEVFVNEFDQKYGKYAHSLFEASNLSGKTPLRLVSMFDCTWDFTMYAEGFSALDTETKRVDFININRLIKQPPLDTTFISIASYVELAQKKQLSTIPDEHTTPVELADMLDKDVLKALKLVENIPAENNDLMYEVADIKVWSNMGLYLAAKIRGGIALQTYRKNRDKKQKEQAIEYLEKALLYWDNIIEITRPLYNDMPLVHYSEQDGKTWQENDHLRFHWALLRDEVMKDIERAKK